MKRADLEVLIPAAGASTRLGYPKQLAEIDGQSLIQRAVALAQSIEPAAIHVVLGAHRERIARELNELDGVSVHYNPDWPSGMAGSLCTGLEQVRPECRGVLVLLPDQFRVNASDLERLVTAWQSSPDRPAAAAYEDTFGVPAILPRGLFPQVMALRGDRGARALLSKCRNQLVTVPMPGAAFDLDTPEDILAATGVQPSKA